MNIIADNLCVIPARGGSKRIPKKNIKSFLGKPIIAYSIEVALESQLFSDVIVSTEDEEIAEIAIKYGASVPFIRSKKNSDDYATTLEVLKEVEMQYRTTFHKEVGRVCCIYPTAPLLSVQHILEGFQLLNDKNLDLVFPVVAYSYPIWRGLEIVDGFTKLIWPEYQNHRSQDLKKVYHDAGQWYWYKASRIKDTLFTNNIASVVLEENDVQDIDTISDWVIAEMKYRKKTLFL